MIQRLQVLPTTGSGAKVSESNKIFRFRVAELQKVLWELLKSELTNRL